MDEMNAGEYPSPFVVLRWRGLMYVVSGGVSIKDGGRRVEVDCGGDVFASFSPGPDWFRLLKRRNGAEVTLPDDATFTLPDIVNHFTPYKRLD